MRSYGTYNCKVPKKIRTVRIIGPVRIIGTLEYNSNWKKILEFRDMQENLENTVKVIPTKDICSDNCHK